MDKKNTHLSAGLLVLIDPSAPVPVEPIFNYYHSFGASGWTLLVDLPVGIRLKKQITSKAWVSLKSDQHSYSVFYDNDHPFIDGKFSFNTIELKNGLSFEYLVSPKILTSIEGGLQKDLSARFFKDGGSFHEAAIKSKRAAAPYVSLSLSLLSF